MLQILTRLVVVASVALPATEALYVAPGSPCTSSCGNTLDSTSPDDVVCQVGNSAKGYNNDLGGVFQTCLECEMKSAYATADNHTDTLAMLYNMRYTLSYCVFNFPKNDHYLDTPCATRQTCSPFMNAIQHQNLSVTNDGFGYCDRWNTGDMIDLQGCVACLETSEEVYLANFITFLQAGCVQKPAPGTTVAVSGDPFSTSLVRVSTQRPLATVNPDWFGRGALTLGARVGIALGVLVVVLVMAGAAVIWRGKKRRRAFLRQLEMQYAGAKNGGHAGGAGGAAGGGGGGGGGWPSPQLLQGGTPQRDMGETPLSQRPLRGWNDSPVTVSTEKTFPRYFSPYSSQYNSPVSALEGQMMAWPEPALGSPRDNYSPLWSQSPQMSAGDKGKTREESYEMQLVDPGGNGSRQ